MCNNTRNVHVKLLNGRSTQKINVTQFSQMEQKAFIFQRK